MDSKVYHGFFRELYPYTFYDLQNELKIEDEELLKSIIRTMKSHGIMKSAKSDLIDYENLSDQDLIFTDGSNTSSDVVYLFKFVGIVLLNNAVIKCYPKYIDINDRSIIQKGFELALKAIEKYEKSKTQNISLYDGSSSEKSFNKIETELFLLQDYYLNNLYTTQKHIIEDNGYGEILFDRTIEQTTPIIQDGEPYYIDLKTRRNLYDDTNYIRQLHKSILNTCSSDLEITGLLDIFGYEPIEFISEELEYFGDKDYILSKIEAEIRSQFVSQKVMLLKTLYAYVKSEYGNDTSFQLSLFGTTSFNLLWEKACSSIFCNVLNLKIRSLKLLNKLDSTIKSSYDENQTLMNLIEQARWEINDKVLTPTDTLEPDIVSIDEHGKKFYILDGKYYIVKEDETSISNQPGIQDIVKQFAYNKAYDNFIQEFNFASVGNAFLMPQVYSKIQHLDRDIVFKGTVQLDLMQLYALSFSAPIQVLELNPQFVLENYIKGINCENILFDCENELNWSTNNSLQIINSEDKSENALLGLMEKDYFEQVCDRISNNNLDSFPFYFVAMGTQHNLYSIDSSLMNANVFIGYSLSKDIYIIGNLVPNIKLLGKDNLNRKLQNIGFEVNLNNGLSYYLVEITSPKFVNKNDIQKLGINLEQLSVNALFNQFNLKTTFNNL